MPEVEDKSSEDTDANPEVEVEVSGEDSQDESKPVKDADYWRKRSRQNEAVAKRNAEKAESFDRWQESKKTADEKQAEELAGLKAQVASQEQQILRQQVAAEKGLEPELAQTLTGNTAEDMAAHADRLLAAGQNSNRGTPAASSFRPGRPNAASASGQQLAASRLYS